MFLSPRGTMGGGTYPPWNLDFPILHKPWFCLFWGASAITIFLGVKFWEEPTSREVCSLHTGVVQSIFVFCIDFFTFHGGFNPPWIRLGSSPASWGRLPLIKTRSGCLYKYPRGSLSHEHIGLHRFHGVDFHGGTLPHEWPCCAEAVSYTHLRAHETDS